MKPQIITTFSWVVVAWTCNVFLSSLPYKFSGHPDIQHIFSTIGARVSSTLSNGLGIWFTEYGAYAVGIDKAPERVLMHSMGGILATGVMTGATFFHLVTPLAIEVLYNGQSDHGSLFYAAVSIMVLGIIMVLVNYTHWRSTRASVNSTL